MRKPLKTRVALVMVLALVFLRGPIGRLINGLFPDLAFRPAVYYEVLMVLETLMWGLPALALLPWRSALLPRRRCGVGFGAAMVLLGVVAQAATMPLTLSWLGATGAQQASVPLPRYGMEWLLAVLALAVTPALMEESFFRGGLMTALLDGVGTWPALTLTTVIFALMHGSLLGLPAQLCVSLLFGLAMLNSGSVWPGILLHMGYNGAALLLRAVPPEMIPALPLAVILAAAALVMASQIQPRKALGWFSLPDWLLTAAAVLSVAAMYIPELI